tara:strand:- start:1022 stop:1483 length:462 start_codon:yes stop_codon:yes gene_type:complete
MSEFECNVKDLETTLPNNNQESYNKKVEENSNKSESINQPKPKIENSPVSVRTIKNDISNSKPLKTDNRSLVRDTAVNIILNDIKDKKNHRIFLVIVVSYIILNSSTFYKIFNDMFPYLMDSVNQVNIKGQLVIALLISLAVIISKSSLLNQP